MLGASLYLSEPLAFNLAQLEQFSRMGMRTVFTSLHIPEEDPDVILSQIKTVAETATAHDLTLAVDVSTATFERFDVPVADGIDYFKELGVSGLRMDYGFTPAEIAAYGEHFDIFLNASTLTAELTKELQANGLDLGTVRVMHNFYPRPETGLGRQDFILKNKRLREAGYRVQAFIPGDDKKRGPLGAGLPTLEEHRWADPLFAYADLIQNCHVDEVLIGDISVTPQTAERLQEYLIEGTLTLPVTDLAEDLPMNFYTIHHNRKDAAELVIRSARSRPDLKYEPTIGAAKTEARPRGAITLDNDQYGRYRGELQIVKRDLPADPRVNVLGHVSGPGCRLLELIGGGQAFRFVEVTGDDSSH